MILVAFLGNDVMGDDGIGSYLYKYVKDMMPEYARGVYLHTDVLRLMSEYNGEDTIVFVDALYGGSVKCGDVKIVPFHKIDILDATMKHAHEIGLIDSLKLMDKVDNKMANARKIFYLIGIDKENVKPSTSLSDCLRIKIHEISSNLLKLIHKIHYSC